MFKKIKANKLSTAKMSLVHLTGVLNGTGKMVSGNQATYIYFNVKRS